MASFRKPLDHLALERAVDAALDALTIAVVHNLRLKCCCL